MRHIDGVYYGLEVFSCTSPIDGSAFVEPAKEFHATLSTVRVPLPFVRELSPRVSRAM